MPSPARRHGIHRASDCAGSRPSRRSSRPKAGPSAVSTVDRQDVRTSVVEASTIACLVSPLSERKLAIEARVCGAKPANEYGRLEWDAVDATPPDSSISTSVLNADDVRPIPLYRDSPVPMPAASTSNTRNDADDRDARSGPCELLDVRSRCQCAGALSSSALPASPGGRIAPPASVDRPPLADRHAADGAAGRNDVRSLGLASGDSSLSVNEVEARLVALGLGLVRGGEYGSVGTASLGLVGAGESSAPVEKPAPGGSRRDDRVSSRLRPNMVPRTRAPPRRWGWARDEAALVSRADRTACERSASAQRPQPVAKIASRARRSRWGRSTWAAAHVHAASSPCRAADALRTRTAKIAAAGGCGGVRCGVIDTIPAVLRYGQEACQLYMQRDRSKGSRKSISGRGAMLA